ncbi:YgaP family membrane protein [Kaarinaea lacus]
MNKVSVQNITNSDRVVRIVAGLGLALSVSLQSGPLGMAAILPLIAIYPIMTGVVGWDPVVQYIATRKQHAAKPVNGSVSNAV